MQKPSRFEMDSKERNIIMSEDKEFFSKSLISEDANKKKFKQRLKNTVMAKFTEEMKKIENTATNNQYYWAGKSVTQAVRNIFINSTGGIPDAIESALQLSEAIIAPSMMLRAQHLKAVIGIAGGVAGIAAIIGGIGLALGWGASIIATVTAFFTGTTMLGPLGWIAGGVTLTAIAAYFSFVDNSDKRMSKFLNAVLESTDKAIDSIWAEYGDKLTEMLNK